MVNYLSSNGPIIPTIYFAPDHRDLNFKPQMLNIDVGYGSLLEYANICMVGVLF